MTYERFIDLIALAYSAGVAHADFRKRLDWKHATLMFFITALIIVVGSRGIAAWRGHNHGGG